MNALTRSPRHPVVWAVAASSIGFAIVRLDVTVVNVALPRIAAQLGASIAELQWIVDAYATAFADKGGAARTLILYIVSSV